jgi:capsular polysaccharide biosynthesis protein
MNIPTIRSIKNFPRLLGALKSKLLWIISITALFALNAFVFASLQPSVYEARATILVDETSGGVPSYEAVLANERRAQTYAYLFTSEALLTKAFAAVEKRFPDLEELDALKLSIDVQAVRGTQLIRVAVRDISPQRATTLADALVAAFNDRFREIYTERDLQNQTKLEEQRALVEGQIAKVSADMLVVTGTTRLQLEPVLVQLRTSQADLVRQITTVQLAAARNRIGATQVDPFVASEKPVSPNKPLLVIVSSLLGLVIITAVIIAGEIIRYKNPLKPIKVFHAHDDKLVEPPSQLRSKQPGA